GPFWVNPYIEVTPSQLNWVEIHYYKTNANPIRRTSVRLSGTGLVELKKGTSELITNDFAKHSDSDGWEAIKTQRVHVDPDHINNVFQNLVNYGLLDHEKNFKGAKPKKDADGNEMEDPNKNRFLGVKANINNISYSDQVNIFTVDPDLAEQLVDVIRQFDNPTL
ncbi:MAG: hypothetical protein J6W80_04640, partial [Kiritimatiellae bacterium]|nr:hypothetical protein [Kiritimatiellia bacterium]